MKIFKNRGDIYMPKSKLNSSKESKILIALLVIIVGVTICVLAMVSQKYDHSFKKFIAADSNITQVDKENENTTVQMPKISGKSNIIFIETNNDNTAVHYVVLVQIDNDNVAYKVATLSPKTVIDSLTINDIYVENGAPSLLTKLSLYFGFDIDSYIQFTDTNLDDFSNELGNFEYTSPIKIKYNGGVNEDKYLVKIKQGKQTLTGKEMSNTVRYYINEKQDFTSANQLFLDYITQIVNEDNAGDSESLFRMFINKSSTNITVRDFANSMDSLTVFSNHKSSVTVYNVVAKYDGKNAITPSSNSDIKGYFSNNFLT